MSLNREKIEKYSQLHDSNFWYLVPKISIDSYVNSNNKEVSPLKSIERGIAAYIKKEYEINRVQRLVSVESLNKYNLYYATSIVVSLNNPKTIGLNISLFPMDFWNNILTLINKAFKSTTDIEFVINSDWTSNIENSCVFSVPHNKSSGMYYKISKDKINRFFSLMNKIENGKLKKFEFKNSNVINIQEFINDIAELSNSLHSLDMEEDDDLNDDIFYGYHMNRPNIKLLQEDDELEGQENKENILNYQKLEYLADEEILSIVTFFQNIQNSFNQTSKGKMLDKDEQNPFIKDIIVFEPSAMKEFQNKIPKIRPSNKNQIIQ